MKEIIKRDKYFKYIEKFIWKDVIKVIIWQRRVGKSYILLQVLDYLKNIWVSDNKIVYINKEDVKFDFLRIYKDLYEYCKNYDYVLVDEIQEIKDWEKAVRTFQIEWKDIYITGSNLKLLSGELATFLSGRYISIQIYPLDYREFLKFHNLRKWKNLLKNILNMDECLI